LLTPLNSPARAMRANDIAYYKACLASATALGLSTVVFTTALRELHADGF
jgi:hypothetical protein